MMATAGVPLKRVGYNYGLTDVYRPLKRATNCTCRLSIDTSLRVFPERRLFDQ